MRDLDVRFVVDFAISLAIRLTAASFRWWDKVAGGRHLRRGLARGLAGAADAVRGWEEPGGVEGIQWW